MRKRIRTESLTELVFEYRNKAYGSYELQKKYLKTLFISAVTGIFIFLLIVLIPFLFYLIREARMGLDMEYIYEVEYIPFAPPEDLTLLELARAHSIPPEEKVLVPVVTDTILPEEEQTGEREIEKESEKEEPEKSDSTSYGTRGNETGRQMNTDTVIATTIDVYPRYPGGEEARIYYLRRHVSYPKEAVDNGIQGVVTVVFVIEADGLVTNVKILHGIGGGCDEEAVRVTREMPRWTAGKRSGRPVRVMVKMPIIFRLPKQ
ncbi:MAG: energy transducer TonB [Bacteroidetes bacterium]|nr:MAG: energy transducer TonB [Bacteroidota bacterium]